MRNPFLAVVATLASGFSRVFVNGARVVREAVQPPPVERVLQGPWPTRRKRKHPMRGIAVPFYCNIQRHA